MMTQYFPIIVVQESNGTVSAWVAGLPGVYAAAATPRGCRPSHPRQEIDRRAWPSLRAH
jgi:hypothetical protein